MRPYRAASQTLGRGTATPGPPLLRGHGARCAARAERRRRRSRPSPRPRGCANDRCLGYVSPSCWGRGPHARGAGVLPPGRELRCVPSRPRSLPRSAGLMASPFWEWPWGARGHPSHAPRWLLEDARKLPEPRAPAGMGESGDFETQRLKVSNLTFDEDFCRLSIFSYLPSQNPLHLWCAFRAAMNFKMCKNDRILTKALIFLFIFMCFIN